MARDAKLNHKDGKLLYHLTHFKNVESILKDGLKARNNLVSGEFIDVADNNILDDRKNYSANLSDYVLFHFYARNPFAGCVLSANKDEDFVFITVKRDFAKKNNFLIIPIHPLSSKDEVLYSYDEGFDLIKWNYINQEDDRDYKDNDIKHYCMAECLSPVTIAPENIEVIYVKNDDTKEKLEKLAESLGVRVTVIARSTMF